MSHPPLLSSTAPSCPLDLTFENFKEEKMPYQDGCQGVRMEGEPVPPVYLASGGDVCARVTCRGSGAPLALPH